MTASFSDMLLAEPLLRSLDKLGYTEPTPVQAQVIPPALEGRDLLVSAATGTGKTAAYLLPILQRFVDEPRPTGGTRALVLAPTRELAGQILDQFLGLASHTRAFARVITGGAPLRHQIADLRKNPELVIATPGRLLEHLERGSADLSELELLVLDEADRMLDMGFAVEVLNIIGQCNADRQSLLLSATLDHRGLQPITDRLLSDPLVVTANPVRERHPDIHHQMILSDDTAHKQRQLLWLLENETFEKALVFVNSRDFAGQLGAFLIAQGQRAGVLHGELDQRERNRIMGLLRSGQIRVLVGTDLAARGLDLEGLDLVVNFELARSGDDYLHRTGRTGRAGQQGLALSLVSAPEWNRAGSIERYLRLEFERRTLPGLEAKFKGPKRQKASGQAAGRKRSERPPAKSPKARVKERARDRKDKGKPRRLR